MNLAIAVIPTGMPKPLLELDNPSQPYLLDFGAILFDDLGNEIEQLSTFVKPGPSAKLTTGAYKTHGISLELANRIGQDPDQVFHWFRTRALQARRIVGHNVHLSSHLMSIAGIRATGDVWFSPCEMFCTMAQAADLMHLPPTPLMLAARQYQSRSPTLSESYERFVGRPLIGPRSAIDDSRAIMQLYFHMQAKPVSV